MPQKVDTRNKTVESYVNGKFVAFGEPAIAVRDSGFLHGAQAWSSPRLVNERIFQLELHLKKIRDTAEMNFFPVIPSDEEIITAIKGTLQHNNMTDGVHIRVILTAGTQFTASMSIDCVCDWNHKPVPPTLIIDPEYRPMVYDAEHGLKLMTSKYLSPEPHIVDKRSHDNNQRDRARACYEAKNAGFDAAVLYGTDGFLAEAHASHMAIVKDGEVKTPFVKCCPDGITRKMVLLLCKENNISSTEADITKEEVESADELIVMGTMSSPVGAVQLDDIIYNGGKVGPLTKRILSLIHI